MPHVARRDGHELPPNRGESAKVGLARHIRTTRPLSGVEDAVWIDLALELGPEGLLRGAGSLRLVDGEPVLIDFG